MHGSQPPDARAGVDVPSALAPFIEHTQLRPEASPAQLQQLSREAVEHGFAGICVHATALVHCLPQIRGTGVRAVTVVGFPLGAAPTAAKVCEAREAVRLGAQELDMVLHLGALLAGDLAYVQADIAAVVAAAAPWPVKVILETALLDGATQVAAAQRAARAGAAFVKTCTGFAPGPGAQVADVARLRASVPAEVQIKASGGIRTAAQAYALLRAGASRLGASSSVALIQAAP